MIEKKVTVSEERTIYVAFDGVEFTSKKDCKAYEASVKAAAAQKVVDNLPGFICSPDWGDCDSPWAWYYLSSQEELDAVFTTLYNEDASANEYKAAAFPCWLAFYVNESGYGYVVGTLKQVVETLNAFRDEVMVRAYLCGHGIDPKKEETK